MEVGLGIQQLRVPVPGRGQVGRPVVDRREPAKHLHTPPFSRIRTRHRSPNAIEAWHPGRMPHLVSRAGGRARRPHQTAARPSSAERRPRSRTLFSSYSPLFSTGPIFVLALPAGNLTMVVALTETSGRIVFGAASSAGVREASVRDKSGGPEAQAQQGFVPTLPTPLDPPTRLLMRRPKQEPRTPPASGPKGIRTLDPLAACQAGLNGVPDQGKRRSRAKTGGQCCPLSSCDPGVLGLVPPARV